MRHYETIYIVDPNLSDEEYGEVTKKFNNLIEKQKGVIIKTDEWGAQKLAYRVKKFDKGSYVLVDYCGNPGLTVELERALKLDSRIIKYQTVNLADNVDPEELILKEKEKEIQKTSAIEEDQGLEKEPMIQNENSTSIEEVENGV
jgi:small subunit ribosomal protein S6